MPTLFLSTKSSTLMEFVTSDRFSTLTELFSTLAELDPAPYVLAGTISLNSCRLIEVELD